MAVAVFEGVLEGVMGVNEGVSVIVGVNVGVIEAVKVNDGVRVAGVNWVNVIVGDGVLDGVRVVVGVRDGVLVRVSGVGLRVAVAVIVEVGVAEGVRLLGSGARAIATKPMQ